ncbi:MAG: hypothetical protein IKM81_05415 [Fibrobacter sp.]|nr:hypothetical protein [Fibrobacter sp.]
MAAPTSTNEVTARKLSSSISALWTKIKSTFQPVADRVTSIRAASSATDTNYPTEKAVRTELDKMAPGAITTDAVVANGDKLLFSDVSDSGKIKRMSGVTFDAATKNRFLSRNGTFEQVLEADVDWGGTARSGSKAPIETFTRQNAWFGPKPSAVYAEYTTNLTADNPTWTDYGLTDVQKQKLFSGTDVSVAMTAGKATHVHPGYTGTTTAAKDLTPEMEPDQGVRVTICCRSLSTRDVDTDNWCYSFLRRILIYVATSSSRDMKVKVEKQTGTRYKSNDDVWEDLGTFALSGDSGWNSIPVSSNFGGGWTQNSNIYTMRFTFWAESMSPTPAASQTGCCRVMGIVALNHIMWTASGLSPEMQRSGLPCAIAYDGSVTFPANVKAPTFEGKFKTARKLAVSLSNTSTDTSFDGSADETNIKTTGTLGVGNGGTGKASVTAGNYVVGAGTSAMVEKTPKEVGSNVLSSLDDKSNASNYANFVDGDFVVGSDHVDASTISASTFVRRTALNLWKYIKSKLSGSDVNIGGNAATATKATQDADGSAINTTYKKLAGSSKFTEPQWIDDRTRSSYNDLRIGNSFKLLSLGISSAGNLLLRELAGGRTNSPTSEKSIIHTFNGGTEYFFNGKASNAGTADALADDSAYVHKSGSETISGTKKFTAAEVNSDSSSGTYSGFFVKRTAADNGNKVYRISLEVTNSGSRGIYDYGGNDYDGDETWIIRKTKDGDIKVGKSTDKVYISDKCFDFSGTIGSDANTFYLG